MKKRKLTKKDRKAQRDVERSSRGVLTGWDRAEAVMWRDEFGVDVREVGPDLIRAVQARDIEVRRADVERSKLTWPHRTYWQCSECAYLDTWIDEPDNVFSTCLGCGAAMTGGRLEAY